MKLYIYFVSVALDSRVLLAVTGWVFIMSSQFAIKNYVILMVAENVYLSCAIKNYVILTVILTFAIKNYVILTVLDLHSSIIVKSVFDCCLFAREMPN